MQLWTSGDVVRWKIIVISTHEEISFNIIYGYRCNYACEGCCVGSNHVSDVSQDPDLDTVLAAIDRLPGVIRMQDSEDFWQRGMITLLGGEPMLYWHERIVPIARAVRRNFPRVRLLIFSNGHLMHRHADDIIDFLDEVSGNITITNHLRGDPDSTLGRRWWANTQEFLSHPRLIKIHDEHYHIDGNIESNINFYDAEEWFTWYRQMGDGKIKPFDSKNPARSMQYGCASGSVCSTLFENRLYKCASLAMLPGLLRYTGQYQDPDWQPYLDYPYIDVFDPDPDAQRNFSRTFGQPIPQCTMCNDQPSNVIQWIDRREHSVIKSHR